MSPLGKTLLAGFLTAIAALSFGVSPARAAAPQAEAAAPVPKRILVLYDENKDDLPGLARIDRTMRESFRSELGSAVAIHSESLGLSQFDRDGYDVLLADFY